VAIHLIKNLPVAAGIGGGSADAAAALTALNDYWALGYSLEELETVALELGADVPACLHRRALFVQGIGDRLKPVELGFAPGIVLVNPLKSVSTPEIFRALKDRGQPFERRLEAPSSVWADLAALESQTHNSLQRVARDLCPEIGDVLTALSAQPGARLVRMSGSGATCFALFGDLDAAARAGEALQARHADWWVFSDRIRSG
jgi:4-diphosphocytidyl-2-C-methyl-D-erythritol kinase